MRDNDTSVETLKAAPKAFYDAVLPFLAEAEAENTLLIGISSRLAARDMPDSPEAFFWVVRDGDEICGAAMWTPPHDLVLSHPFSDAALDTLSEFLLRMQLPLPGAPPPRPRSPEHRNPHQREAEPLRPRSPTLCVGSWR